MDNQLGSLGGMLKLLKSAAGRGLGDLTVLSPQNDPFRLDTPTFHAAGKWLRDRMDEAGLLDRINPIHNRGIFYALVAQGDLKMPGGGKFVNNAACWDWLETVASKAARWLGYVSFDRIVDARNEAPIVRVAYAPSPTPGLRVAAEIELPEDLAPTVVLEDWEPRQRYHLVLWGEKTSLDEVLGPLASAYKASLYLPSGEISDSMLAEMARHGARDGRPMVVIIFADCDPAGHQMAVSIGHKLRAQKERFFPGLEFEVVPAALTVEQVKELGLPSTPLKETERRASRWTAAFGVEQTEIDALATLQPDVLRRIARDAIKPYWDSSLDRRAREARDAWLEEAQQAFERQVDPQRMATLREQAEGALEAFRARLADLELATDDLEIDWPKIDLPEPKAKGGDAALVTSEMDLLEAIDVLRARKRY
jgi:hypothetical protein